jgi:hypothetical protein
MFGLRFFKKSQQENILVEVTTDEGQASFSINPVQLVESRNIRRKDIFIAQSIISENEDLIKRKAL